MNKVSSIIDHFKKFNLEFADPQLLETALTHRSYLNEQKAAESNERLEYLGDAVLELITSDFLFHQFPHRTEGVLTSLRAKIVQTKTLSSVAQQLKLGKFLRLSKGEAASGGIQNPSMLADTFEALVGAIYLDQGLGAAEKFVVSYLLEDYLTLINKSEVQDWKSSLQELVQAQKGTSPAYILVKAEGPDHNRQFTVAVSYFDKQQAVGMGKSKQAAEQAAARKALEKLTKKSKI